MHLHIKLSQQLLSLSKFENCYIGSFLKSVQICSRKTGLEQKMIFLCFVLNWLNGQFLGITLLAEIDCGILLIFKNHLGEHFLLAS